MTDGRVVTQVVDADGGLVQQTLAAPRITVSYERKIGEAHGLPQYESASAYAAVQADVALDGSDRTSAITDAFLTAKSAVYAQLGIQSTVNDENTVVETLVASLGAKVTGSVSNRPAAANRSNTGNAKPKKDGSALWVELESNPSKFFDNRADKASGKGNPAGPDFKRKGTGEGLWIFDKEGNNQAEALGITLPA